MTGIPRPISYLLSTLSLGILFAAIWSSSFVATKFALGYVPPLTLAAIRLLLAGFVLTALQLSQTRGFLLEHSKKTIFKVIIAGLLSQGLYLSGSYWALVNMPTSIVNIAVSSLPLVTLPFAFALLGEKVRCSSVLAFILGMVGVAVTLVGGNDLITTTLTTRGIAAGLLFLAILSLALGNVMVKPIVCSKNLIPICVIQFVSSGLSTFIISIAVEPEITTTAISLSIHSILFLSLIGSILGTIIWFKLLNLMPAGAASSFFLVTPIFGIIFGWMFFNEPVTYAKIVGVLIVCSAILLRTGVPLSNTFFKLKTNGPKNIDLPKS